MPVRLSNVNGKEIYPKKCDYLNERYSISGKTRLNFSYVDDNELPDSFYHSIGNKTIKGDKRPSPIQGPLKRLSNQLVWTFLEQPTETTQFLWKYGGNKVFLTGTFDHWKGSVPMTQMDQNTFKVELTLDKSIDNQYKFIVDGVWCYDIDLPSIKDADGNENNIIYAHL
ncbi:carbohydrate-binding module family 48 protein [Backusella circina FSU 941]|nr:carbohydrate-binding module family 48 protein [Backusella circina FSU 941]